jgi:hypothetical protein
MPTFRKVAATFSADDAHCRATANRAEWELDLSC